MHGDLRCTSRLNSCQIHRIVAFPGSQAKREQQLVEQRQAKDAAAKQRHQDEADAAATAAAHIQAQMKVPFFLMLDCEPIPVLLRNRLEAALHLRYKHTSAAYVHERLNMSENRILVWHCNVWNCIIKIWS